MVEGVVSLLITIWIVTMILYSIVYVVLKYVFRIKVERFDWTWGEVNIQRCDECKAAEVKNE